MAGRTGSSAPLNSVVTQLHPHLGATHPLAPLSYGNAMSLHACSRRLCCLSLGLILANGLREVGAAQPTDSRRPPAPEEITLTTKDGVELRATYFPSDAGRDATPIVLLHDQNEARAAYRNVALALQNPELPGRAPTPRRAVVAVDLRGHGQSKAVLGAGGRVGEIDAARFRAVDYEDMVVFDLEAVRSFLVARNDEEALNLNKLCLMGVGMGANVALTWAEKDWRTPNLPVRKQGQDVQALVLISPRWKFEGLSAVGPLKFPPIQRGLSIFLAYGKDDRKFAEDGNRIYSLLKKSRPDVPVDQLIEKQDLFQIQLPTQLQGVDLVQRSGFSLVERINAFVAVRLDNAPFAYFRRK